MMFEDCESILCRYLLFPGGCIPSQLPFIKVDRLGEGGLGCRADGELNKLRGNKYLFGNTYEDSV